MFVGGRYVGAGVLGGRYVGAGVLDVGGKYALFGANGLKFILVDGFVVGGIVVVGEVAFLVNGAKV